MDTEAAGTSAIKINLSVRASPIAVILALGLLVRLGAAFLPGFAVDLGTFQGWSMQLADQGPWNFYTPDPFPDWAPGYMYVLWFFGGLNTVFEFGGHLYWYLLKLPSIAADLASAYLLYLILEGQKPAVRSWAVALYLLNPVVLLVGPVWGQVDSLLAFFLLFTVYYLARGRTLAAAVVYTIGFLTKPQALAALPIFVFWGLRQEVHRVLPALSASGDLLARAGEFVRAPRRGRTAAGLWRRYAAVVVDILLFYLLFIVGWFIWFVFTAKEGQTPGKKLLGLRVIQMDGTVPEPRTMWLREVVIKGVLWNTISGGVGALVAYIWAFFDKDGQALHDKMVKTYVIRAPVPVQVKRAGEFVRVFAARVWPVPAAALAVALVMVFAFFPSNPIGIIDYGIIDQLSDSQKLYPFNSFFAFNFWEMFGRFKPDDATFIGVTYRWWGFVLFGLSSLGIMWTFRDAKGPGLLALGTALSVLAFFLFVTRMHERYLFPSILLLVTAGAALNARYIWAILGVLTVVQFLNVYYAYINFTEDNYLRVGWLWDWIDDQIFLISLITFLTFPVLLAAGFLLATRERAAGEAAGDG